MGAECRMQTWHGNVARKSFIELESRSWSPDDGTAGLRICKNERSNFGRGFSWTISRGGLGKGSISPRIRARCTCFLKFFGEFFIRHEFSSFHCVPVKMLLEIVGVNVSLRLRADFDSICVFGRFE